MSDLNNASIQELLEAIENKKEGAIKELSEQINNTATLLNISVPDLLQMVVGKAYKIVKPRTSTKPRSKK